MNGFWIILSVLATVVGLMIVVIEVHSYRIDKKLNKTIKESEDATNRITESRGDRTSKTR